MTTLVIDIGTSSVRATAVRPDATIAVERQRPFLPDSPFAGLVEFDAAALARIVLELGRAVVVAADAAGEVVTAMGVTNQRASTIVWDRATGDPVAPAQGWQDLRTVFDCLTHQADGLALAPNMSAPKLASILDAVDPDRTRDLCFGTVDSWTTWVLSEGASHITDATNAAVTGLRDRDNGDWDDQTLAVLRIDRRMLPTVVDSSGELAVATALPGAPPITGLIGDQQASLVGQGCVRPGLAKITFGTGGSLDLCVGDARPAFATRGTGGTFPINAWRLGGHITWGVEAIMLAAGTNVEWLRDDLGMIATAEESDTVAARCADADGVVYVPALLGLGTPKWDFGARGTMLGVTRGTTRAHFVRAVLEGVAHRGADLVEAATIDSGLAVAAIRIDGGMSRNRTFTQALANATGRSIEISRAAEATTNGAAFIAGLATGVFPTIDAIADTWDPITVVEPNGSLDRDQWRRALERAGEWLPDLSALHF